MTERSGGVHVPLYARVGRILYNLVEDGRVGRAWQMGINREPHYISKEVLTARYSRPNNQSNNERNASNLAYWQAPYTGGMIVPYEGSIDQATNIDK